MDYKTFRDEVFAQAKAKGFEDYELYYSAGNGFSVRVFKGEIAEYKNSSTEGVGFRGTYGGKMGYSYSEKLDTALIVPMLANAMANAGIIEEEEVEKLYPGDKEYQKVDGYSPAINDTEASEKIQMALDMEKYALSLDPRLTMADYCSVANQESHVAISNSYGLDLSQKTNRAYAYMLARAEEDGVTKSGMEVWYGKNFADFDYKSLAKKAVDTAVSYLGASPVPTGEYPVIFDTYTAADLFGVFSKIFIAESGQKGFSLLNKDKVGETIAAPHVTIRDDGITELSLENSAFDAEGVATQNKAVIENGVLKTLLYNTKSAAKDGVESTGNASKPSFGGAISTSTGNFYLVPGEKSFEDLISGVENGVLITELAGLHSGANVVSGDFSFSADGFLIENGKIARPIDQITVAGNFYELLKNISEVGSDLRFHYFSGLIGMPSFLTGGLKIAGL
ncbi:MAG: TldD/PmbA family protein [Defluviitaleaceae bacterium]|nr:TldD/PmbA family protein [Defluviitaleaceae bacterium]